MDLIVGISHFWIVPSAKLLPTPAFESVLLMEHFTPSQFFEEVAFHAAEMVNLTITPVSSFRISNLSDLGKAFGSKSRPPLQLTDGDGCIESRSPTAMRYDANDVYQNLTTTPYRRHFSNPQFSHRIPLTAPRILYHYPDALHIEVLIQMIHVIRTLQP